MKKITILFAFIICANVFVSCADSNAKTKINKGNLDKAKSRDLEIKKGTASISVDNNEYDFGTVNEGDIVEKTFLVTNSGKTDLVITDARVTCGCTVPAWPKAPIKPGETKEVKVKFNTASKRNRQRKNITLITNTESGREVLTLKGMVTPKAK
ncbi:DUF1573 domain-containing protein [Polaribacter ponticola]|uniref:DUF1573 domain-containing protein n=1 Tax=Polaribacter ponticola TaxID=2978475 RepID=A0ABT5SCW5_9FLAO|nr:DUF1573 domain-containing protein [Polaribacter sp. MSW5]MDD7915972.1 DUF1573 domain-containing protein [Polaribacter sp. MSW5]